MSTQRDPSFFYAFTAERAPILHVAQGEDFTLNTKDCYGNQLQSDDDTLDSLDWSMTNPATGPVYIEGVKSGDVVRIDIKKLQLTGNSVMALIPGAGAIGGVTESSTRIMKNDEGKLHVMTTRGELQLPLKPMIGVIGLAPAGETISNGVPGMHGGNMDCTLIGEGASLYLHASVDGGLFGCGDVHALMGDGEVCVCGAETPARVTIATRVVDTPALPTPFVETDRVYATIASADTADQAYQLAVDHMFTFLTEIVELDPSDTARLMSLVGELRFCQVVDPKITVRFEFPKSVLSDLGFKGV